ncbi:hypothetical protein BBJ29_006839 [Phytophthora kernoviae]|uniref:Apple domain-containing protein n=1 Tax=Phytophthora kernoviae TaxID=325452 RepID=A0A3F2RF49_9STRA|nr:hypothetical protein BBP00_00008522 [Phytophthora kernoviae]RLN66051.1 hypothetical protein BBJ29_006839 [Phytophthora kernoviae]
MLARVFTVLASLAAVAAGDCAPTFGNCGSDSAGANCCQSNQYCQPWNSNYYQCLDLPAKCTQQFPNIDFNGDDLETIYGLQPGECCTKCSETSGCKAYTFVNNNPGRPACYLKKGTGTRKSSAGAVSGIVSTTTPTPTPTPTPTCNTPANGFCGTSTGTTCCPSGYYCQPWNDNYYQCIQPPSKCAKQRTDTDFYGNDIKTVNPGQPVCYLKSSAGTASTKIGAVSGTLN